MFSYRFKWHKHKYNHTHEHLYKRIRPYTLKHTLGAHILNTILNSSSNNMHWPFTRNKRKKRIQLFRDSVFVACFILMCVYVIVCMKRALYVYLFYMFVVLLSNMHMIPPLFWLYIWEFLFDIYSFSTRRNINVLCGMEMYYWFVVLYYQKQL